MLLGAAAIVGILPEVDDGRVNGRRPGKLHSVTGLTWRLTFSQIPHTTENFECCQLFGINDRNLCDGLVNLLDSECGETQLTIHLTFATHIY